MSKTNNHIFIDTITREFIKFAKIIGIFPKISYLFWERTRNLYHVFDNEKVKYVPIAYCNKKSFYEYARIEGRSCNIFLNDGFIKRVYLFSAGYGSYDVDSFENADELADLFLNYLRDKGYPRYIRIIR